MAFFQLNLHPCAVVTTIFATTSQGKTHSVDVVVVAKMVRLCPSVASRRFVRKLLAALHHPALADGYLLDAFSCPKLTHAA